jgi:hypothetical protein
VLLDPLGPLVTVELLVLQEKMELLVCLVDLELMDLVVYKAYQVRRVSGVHLVFLDKEGNLVQWDRRVLKVHQVLQVNVVHRVPLENLVRREREEKRVKRVKLV